MQTHTKSYPRGGSLPLDKAKVFWNEHLSALADDVYSKVASGTALSRARDIISEAVATGLKDKKPSAVVRPVFKKHPELGADNMQYTAKETHTYNRVERECDACGVTMILDGLDEVDDDIQKIPSCGYCGMHMDDWE